MKSFMMSIMAALLVFAVSGCCSTGSCTKAKAAEKCCKKACPVAKKCTMPCAKAKKCPFTGKWEFFVSQNGKLTALPVDHSPKLELCKKGVVRFHYVKDGKAAVVQGKWKVADGKLVISDAAGKSNQYDTIQKDGSAEFSVGKNDRLPENTKVIIRKVK
jgi:hypothetical protein